MVKDAPIKPVSPLICKCFFENLKIKATTKMEKAIEK